MAKPLERDASTGRLKEVQPVVTSAGAGDAGKMVQLDSAGRLDATVMPVGIGADTYVANASGNLSAGDAVYITSGGLIARASAATSGNQAMGFVLVAATSGNSATMLFEGRNTALSGLTPGVRYYLSDSTPGAVTATPVSGSGKLHQLLGQAVSSTSLDWEREDGVLLA